MSTPEDTLRNLQKMADEAYRGGLYLKAAKLYHQAGALAQELRDERQRVTCLWWEGACFSTAGKDDDALPLLMEAAATRSPDADPADVYNASTKAIEISLTRKPASFCRKLIQQTRAWLTNNRKEEWWHKLDLLAGELEFQRGELEAAYRYFGDAYAVWRYEYPAYTEASHLRWLCKTAFQRRDVTNLRKWVAAIEAHEKYDDEDAKIRAQESRLLLFRAERQAGDAFDVAADLALTVIDHEEMIEGVTGDYLIPALRVLVLARRWLDVERVIERYAMKNTEEPPFQFLGDERLSRAREALGMAAQDDEYDMEFADPAPPFPDAPAALRFLREATAFYEHAMEKARKEDERLDTTYDTRTVNERLARAQRIAAAVR